MQSEVLAEGGLSDPEREEVIDEVALLLRGIVARQSSDLAVAFIEVVGLCFVAYHDNHFPPAAMESVRKSLQKFPKLADHIEVLAKEAAHRAKEKAK